MSSWRSTKKRGAHASEDDLRGFRWSWDEIKNMIRGSNGSRGGAAGSSQRTSGSGKFPMFRDGLFRWSFEDLKSKIRRSRSSRNSNSPVPGTGKRGKNKRTRDEVGTMNPLVVTEQFQKPKPEDSRKVKKSKQEAARRQRVKELFIQLGTMMEIENPESKGAKVQILAAAKDKLMSKKGVTKEQRAQLEELFRANMDLDMDYDSDEE
jgi:hypothetical protein